MFSVCFYLFVCLSQIYIHTSWTFTSTNVHEEKVKKVTNLRYLVILVPSEWTDQKVDWN